MTEDLLDAAMRRAEVSDPAVRAVALLRIARVLTARNQADAEALLDRGLAQVAKLSDEDSAAITPQAICIAACVAPKRGLALHAAAPDSLPTEKFLFDMVRHGQVAAAVEYLTRWSDPREFPYHAAHDTIGHTKDEESRRDILRSALQAWHSAPTTWRSIASVLDLFHYHWHLLPEDEARREIRDLVRVIRQHPNEMLTASFGGARGTVNFSSYRPALLFKLLGPITRVDPDLARRVIREDPELAHAAAIYPAGHDSDRDQPVEPPSTEALEQWTREWTGFALDARFFRLDQEQTSDFRESFDHALRAFARDTSPGRPNAAPRDCWPSAEHFRTILYHAGLYEGAAGARLLDRISDADLRLFAQIELAAGIAGLAQIGGIIREQVYAS